MSRSCDDNEFCTIHACFLASYNRKKISRHVRDFSFPHTISCDHKVSANLLNFISVKGKGGRRMLDVTSVFLEV